MSRVAAENLRHRHARVAWGLPPTGRRTSVLSGSGQPAGSTHCLPVSMRLGRSACRVGSCWSAAPVPELLACRCCCCSGLAATGWSGGRPPPPAVTAAAAPAATEVPFLPCLFFLAASNSSANCRLPLNATSAGAPQRPQVQPMPALARRACASSRPKKPGRQLAKCWGVNCALSVPGVPLPTSVNPTPAASGMRPSSAAPLMAVAGAMPVSRSMRHIQFVGLLQGEQRGGGGGGRGQCAWLAGSDESCLPPQTLHLPTATAVHRPPRKPPTCKSDRWTRHGRWGCAPQRPASRAHHPSSPEQGPLPG